MLSEIELTPEVRREPGTYALLARAAKARSVRVGSLGELRVCRGTYVYVGSAFGPGGVAARVAHHLRIAVAPRWHMDYLRPLLRIREIWYSHDPVQREHAWTRAFGGVRGSTTPFPGFGASDCGCYSHLFFFERPPSLRSFLREIRADIPRHARVDSTKFVTQE